MIEFTDIHKAFGPKRVLRGFTLTVNDGETMVIIGYSGTGKSVAIKHVVGLLDPDQGHVSVDGQVVDTLTSDRLNDLRSHIGYVFQFAALFDSMNIHDNVAMGLRRRGLPDKDIADRVGSLTPGKRADLILVRTNDLNVAPFFNPALLLVQQAQPYNVDTVIIDGRILKYKGELTALDADEVVSKAAESFIAARKRAGGPY